MPPDRPNVLLIMSDQHRADAMGCAGNTVVETPHLDALAGEGVRFDRAYCQGPLCMPSRASLLTERYVRDHGVYENNWDTPHELPTFVGALRDAGYHTSCIGKMHLYVHGAGGTRDTRDRVEDMRAYGFAEPIEGVGKHAAATIRSEYTDMLEARELYRPYREWMRLRSYGRGQIVVDGKAVDRLPMYHTEPTSLPEDAYIDSWVGQRTEDWIEHYDRDEPFFQWVGFAGPHDPWDAPGAYLARYAGADIGPAKGKQPDTSKPGALQTFIRAIEDYGQSAGLTDDVIRDVRRHYYANVTLIDDRIGRIVAALERKGILRNTWVIYTADHGEMLGDHRMLTKRVFYEPSVRVPLIIRPPGGMTGIVDGGLVEHVDLAATIRAICNAGPVAESEGAPFMDAFEPGQPRRPRDVAHSENFGFAMFCDERYKLLVYEDDRAPVQLFDLVADPDEDTNVVDVPQYADVLAAMMERHVMPFLATPPVRPGPGLMQRLTSNEHQKGGKG